VEQMRETCHARLSVVFICIALGLQIIAVEGLAVSTDRASFRHSRCCSTVGMTPRSFALVWTKGSFDNVVPCSAGGHEKLGRVLELDFREDGTTQ
jgi:hypothetical protein